MSVLSFKGFFKAWPAEVSTLLCAASLVQAQEASWHDGVVQRACAPWDGPGFQVRATDEAGRTLFLEGFAANARRAGVWPIVLAAELDKGTAVLCGPTPAAARCQFASAGQFTLRAGPEGVFDVSVDAVFPGPPGAGRLRGAFKVKPVTSNKVCG